MAVFSKLLSWRPNSMWVQRTLPRAAAASAITPASPPAAPTPAGRRHLEKEWLHGIAEVVPYVPGNDGLGYVLKCPGGPTSAAWQDRCELSDALLVFLKKSPAIERDPFAVELLGTLRARGARAWFGDEVPHWKKK